MSKVILVPQYHRFWINIFLAALLFLVVLAPEHQASGGILGLASVGLLINGIAWIRG